MNINKKSQINIYFQPCHYNVSLSVRNLCFTFPTVNRKLRNAKVCITELKLEPENAKYTDLLYSLSTNGGSEAEFELESVQQYKRSLVR